MGEINQVSTRGGFPTTDWTQIIIVMQEGRADEAYAALVKFCDRYRPAIHGFFRRRGCSHDAAEDLTHSFFESRILTDWDGRTGFLHTAERTGHKRFRNFLAHVLCRFLQDANKKQLTAKRGGTIPHVSLDNPDSGAEHLRTEPSAELGRAVDREIALEIIKHAAGRSSHSKYLIAHLKGEITQKEAADALDLTEEAFKAAYFRFRKRLALDLWDEVAKLAGPDENEIRAEILYLMSLFAEPDA
jgi:DNA-directed RNA polymerase specialized sigma24 family protein